MSSAWGDSWGTCSGGSGSGSGGSGNVTLLQKIKTILDACQASNPSVPTYYYRELPEGSEYPKLDIEGSREATFDSSICTDGPELANGYFKLVLVGETPIGPLEDIMKIIYYWLHPRVFSIGGAGGGSGSIFGDPVLFPGDYTTEQLVERSPSGKPLIKLAQAYRILFGGSF